MGREWCLRQASKSVFGLVWPWPLTSWSQNDRFLPLPREHLCQFASTSVHSCSICYKFRNRRTNGWTNARKNGQVEKNKPPPASLFTYCVVLFFGSKTKWQHNRGDCLRETRPHSDYFDAKKVAQNVLHQPRITGVDGSDRSDSF